ncbi:MAG: rod shape-determining protein MreD [Parvularculales bacterium]
MSWPQVKIIGPPDGLSHRLVLLVLGVLCVLLSIVPIASGQSISLFGGLPIMMIYFWALRQPKTMTPLIVFLIGLFHDFLIGAPAGFYALIYSLIYAIMIAQSATRMRWVFETAWLGFAVVVIIACGLTGFVGFIFIGYGSIWALIINNLLAIALYPLVSFIFEALNLRVFAVVGVDRP